MDFVAIDLGASNTRYVSVDRKVYFADNKMIFLDEKSQARHMDKLDDIPENNLELIITRTPFEDETPPANEDDKRMSENFPAHVIIGELAERYNKQTTQIDQKSHKSSQRMSYVSVILCVALSKLKNPSIGEKINLFQLLPPSEVASITSKSRFINYIRGRYKVDMPRVGDNGTTLEFEIRDVYCAEEGRMAIIQFLLDDKHPENRKNYSNKRLMSIDIGASTTDVCIFNSGKFIEQSAHTFAVGCNNCVTSILKSLEQMGKRLTFNEASLILVDGRMPHGALRKPIPDIVNEAKTSLAEEIMGNLNGYFHDIGISLDSIQYVIVSGGGSMPSSYIEEDTGKQVVVADSIATHISKAIQEYCDGIVVKYIEDDPRTANIRGIGMWASVNQGEIKK